MSKQKIIYAVTDGDYSDYRIVAVFEDEREAEAFREWNKHNMVEKFPLNPELPAMRPGYNLYRLEMRRDGDTNYVMLDRSPASTEHKTNLELYIRHGTLPWRFSPSSILGAVVARDEQHAVKIANEKRAQLIAENKWPTDSERKGTDDGA